MLSDKIATRPNNNAAAHGKSPVKLQTRREGQSDTTTTGSCHTVATMSLGKSHDVLLLKPERAQSEYRRNKRIVRGRTGDTFQEGQLDFLLEWKSLTCVPQGLSPLCKPSSLCSLSDKKKNHFSQTKNALITCSFISRQGESDSFEWRTETVFFVFIYSFYVDQIESFQGKITTVDGFSGNQITGYRYWRMKGFQARVMLVVATSSNHLSIAGCLKTARHDYTIERKKPKQNRFSIDVHCSEWCATLTGTVEHIISVSVISNGKNIAFRLLTALPNMKDD